MKKVGKYTLINDEKLDRALRGSLTREGRLSGGVGEGAEELALLSEYDKLGGLVLKDGIKVKLGAFYDFDKRKPRETPDVSFITELDGELVEVNEEEAQVIKVAKEKTASIKAKKRKDNEDDEEPKKKKLKK